MKCILSVCSSLKLIAGLIVGLLCLNTVSLSAQPRKFGKIDASEFNSYNPEYDSTMSAVVLFDKGEVIVNTNFHFTIEIHKRIKILNDDGLVYGDVELLYPKNQPKNVFNIKANTYNLLPNGRIERKKLGKREIYTSDIGEGIALKKFTFPNLKAGSIIEYSYMRRLGGIFSVPDWQFHDYVPVLWSEIIMYIPVSLDYRLIFKGSDPLYINENKEDMYFGLTAMRYRFAKKDLPAIEDLPFLINRQDHLSGIKTQLVGVFRDGAIVKSFLKTWEGIAKEVNKIEKFGGQELNDEMKAKVDELVEGTSTAPEKIECLYNYVVKNFEWNGNHEVLTGKGIQATFNDKRGNTADLNLMLMEMLRYAGLKASPTLLSTRENGNVIIDYPLIDQFNMVVTTVEFSDGTILLDASSGKRGYRSPHPKILFRNAFVVRDDNSFGWLKTTPLDIAEEKTSMNISFTDSDLLDISISGLAKGMVSEVYREIVDSLDMEKYWEDILEGYEDVEVDTADFSNLNNIGSEVDYNASFQMEAGNDLVKGDSLIYLNPFLFLKRERNPFTKQTRELPIEFSYPAFSSSLVTVNIPEGFVVDELPQSAFLRLPNNAGSYRFVVQEQPGQIILLASFELKAVYFSPSTYSSIKQVFQSMVDTQTAMVVLKKVEESADQE